MMQAVPTEAEHDYLLKVLLIGDPCVGKSTLLLRYADDEWRDGLDATIGVDFKICTHNIQGKVVKMQIWDTAGQERFRTIITSYFRGANGVIVCYDTTDRQSFESVRMWVAESKKFTDGCYLLVGTKADLENDRKVAFEEGAELAEELEIGFVETSAKKDLNVRQAFESLCQDALHFLSKQKAHVVVTQGISLEGVTAGAAGGQLPAASAPGRCCT